MKTLTVKLLAISLLLGCMLTFTSCISFSKPELDIDKAEDALEDEDYLVSVIDGEDAGMPGIKEALTAYSDDDSLTIMSFETKKMAKLYYEQLKLERDHEIESLKHEIKSLKYVLKEFEDDLDSDEIDKYEDELKELEKELKEIKKEPSFGRSGTTVWSGTKDAIKDSKG